MSTKFTRNTASIKEEPKDIQELKMVQLGGSGEMEIRSFEPNKLHRTGEGDYASVRSKYGSLAVTDLDRPHRDAKDARFHLNPLLRDPLMVEAEEQRAIEDRIKKGVHEISEKVKMEAAQKGYEEGFQRGKEEALKIFGKEGSVRLEKFDAILREVDSAKTELFKANERFLIDLIFQISKKIILKEVQMDKEYLTRLATTLLERLDLGDHISILLNPEDRDSIHQIRESLSKQLTGVKNVHIEVNSKVPRGGCRVETNWGMMSASIQSQLEAVEKSLLGSSTGSDPAGGTTTGNPAQ